jgi:predicted RNase H-like nuclease (RuvC/YqgF family)
MTNNLDKNLELRKALAEVDRLTSENVSLDYVCSQQDTIIKDLKDDVNRLTKEQSINLDIIQTQKKRLRSNEVMLRSHERDITALQNKLK